MKILAFLFLFIFSLSAVADFCAPGTIELGFDQEETNCHSADFEDTDCEDKAHEHEDVCHCSISCSFRIITKSTLSISIHSKTLEITYPEYLNIHEARYSPFIFQPPIFLA